MWDYLESIRLKYILFIFCSFLPYAPWLQKKAKLKLFSEHDKNVTNIHEEFSQISDISDPNCLFEDKK